MAFHRVSLVILVIGSAGTAGDRPALPLCSEQAPQQPMHSYIEFVFFDMF